MSTQTLLSITVNGEARRVSAGATIAVMLRELDIDPKRVAVEQNFAIVPRSALEDVPVQDGDRFEIVHFVGGG